MAEELKRKIKMRICIFLLILLSLDVWGQKTPYQPNYNKRFKGGLHQFSVLINSNTRYPREAETAGKQGKAVVGFTLSKSGELKDVKLVNDPAFGMGEEALRVFAVTNGHWIPDSSHHHAIDRYYEVAITFKLVNEDHTKESEKKLKLLLQEKKYAEALETVTDLHNMHPYNIHYLMQRADVFLLMNKSAEACNDFKRVKFLKSHQADEQLKKCG